ncbi:MULTISPECIES: vitamin K epoxide reductase family protein [Actinomyces]|uniref:Vitamin K epoxide reductase family protein n=1 Tax=Actinomyces marmotae TaxID=2737173 RepID=A0A6M8B234_9ACTO|nr:MULTISPECIES: vitamin K epoxide reductase family protein [Actinomyces]QKD79902.1 vitamin K epoxide reductase family protein [Actinomyces marmotae]
MAHVPTQAEIDAMSEEELEAYLASAEGPDSTILEVEGTGATASSGAPRGYAWLLVIGSIIALGACWELTAAHIKQIKEPLESLSCDINPLVSCGASLDIWQGNLLGVPNAHIGAMAFAALLTLGALLLGGMRLPRWVWRGMVAGTIGGILFVAWFLFVSVMDLGKLCPFCMLIWAVTIPVATSTWAWAAAGGHLGVSPATARRLVAWRWWGAAVLYALVGLVVVAGLWSEWMTLLR